MIELILTLFTGGGAVGFGSILKIIAGKVDSSAYIQELKLKAKLANEGKFIQSQDNSYARHTRRMLALIGVSTLAIVTVHCTLVPDQVIVTLKSIASGGEQGNWSLLFGLIEIPTGNKPIQVTTGHLAIMNCITFGMIIGYYFTPGGRK
jgi:hypothetical protein